MTGPTCNHAVSGNDAVMVSPDTDRDHLYLIGVVAIFFACAAVRIGLPPGPIFDERYYVEAARHLAQGTKVFNREHPMLAKEILALGWWLFGNNLGGYRVFPLLFGSAGLYFAARALWSRTGSAFAGITFAILLASGFLLLGLSRMTLLEPFVFFFAALRFTGRPVAIPGWLLRRLPQALPANGLRRPWRWHCLPSTWLAVTGSLRSNSVPSALAHICSRSFRDSSSVKIPSSR